MKKQESTDDAFCAVDGLELLGDLEGAVWGRVVDDNEFPVEVSNSTNLGQYGSCVDESCTDCSVKVCARSQTMMGRLRRSL